MGSGEAPKLRRRDAIGVEDRVDVSERGQETAESLDVADLDDVPVLCELILDVAAVFDDVRSVFGEGSRDVLEQTRAVPRVNRDLDEEAAGGAAVPVDRCKALRVATQSLHVRAVGSMNGDALAHRDVADDVVTRDGRTALGQPDEHVLYALD